MGLSSHRSHTIAESQFPWERDALDYVRERLPDQEPFRAWLVDSGKAAAAFSMHPVSVSDLMAVSDAGAIMPPKSTWFEPKLRDGLLIHVI